MGRPWQWGGTSVSSLSQRFLLGSGVWCSSWVVFCSIKMTTQEAISHLQASVISPVKGEEIPKPAFLVGQHSKRQMGACPSGAEVSWQVELELHDWRQFLSVSLLLTYCLMGLCPDFESI